MSSAVNHPAHYGGENSVYEAIRVIEAWDLGFNLGNTVKYISRAGKKDGAPLSQDLKKAAWYLNREISNRVPANAPKESITNVEIRNFFRHDFSKSPLCNSPEFRGDYSLAQIREMNAGIFGNMSDNQLIIMLLKIPEEVPDAIQRVLITSTFDGLVVNIFFKIK